MAAYASPRQDPTTSNPHDSSSHPLSLCISPVGESVAHFPKQPRRQSIFRKLAGPRENAKRLLRLGTSTPPDTTTTTAAAAAAPRTSRRRPISEIVISQRDAQMLSSADRGGGTMHADAPVTAAVAAPPVADPVSNNSTVSASAESTESFPSLSNERIVATGSGITVGIALTEPVLFIPGYDQNDPSSKKSAILRGQLHLKITKAVKIKKISICFRAHAQTDWPEGALRPPR